MEGFQRPEAEGPVVTNWGAGYALISNEHCETS